ncbi:MAG: tetratricopeptide repeat protein [Pseudomonadota bacterium]|nr:tetratricopeptide repeat protein [Pseudomonadota bacterium]
MRNLTATLCLTIAVLLGSAGMSLSADYQKGLTAYQSGDYATALREWKSLAEQGNARAQFSLGVMYRKGRGVPQDDKTAVKWYTLAAQQGNEYAQVNLGYMYDYGQGVPEDFKTAMKWYILAAEQGDARAQEWMKQHRNMIAKEQERNRIVREKQQERIRIAREKQSASNPGFKDLKPGLSRSSIKDKKVCRGELDIKSVTTCYGIDNLKFFGTFDNIGVLNKLTVDLGPIVGSVGLINQLSTYLQKGETNIYLKMRNALGEKYKLDFEYSERDRQLFNANDKNKLYTVYEKGQVALLVTRKKKGYSHDLWLYIEYRDVKPAQIFFKSTKPKRAKKGDF